MVVIEKSPNLYFRSIEAIVSTEFQPHKLSDDYDSSWASLERLAAAKGSIVQIWGLRFNPTPTDLKLYNFAESTGYIIESKCLCLLTEHAPHYLVALQWSPAGNLLASCDSRQIVISEFVRFIESSSDEPSQNGPTSADSTEPNFYEEQWKTKTKFTDPSFDLFDLCWFGDDHLITGSSDGIKIWNYHEKCLVTAIRCTEGFVTGVHSYAEDFVALQSNDKKCIIFKNILNKSVNKKLSEYLNDTQTLSLGLTEIPYYRRPSFDCLGHFVSFPYGERSNQCFGFAYNLKPLKSDVPPTRFRGHCSRVNCVAFSRNVWRDIEKRKFTLYAQASLDGALSVWKCYYSADDSTADESIPANCLIVMRPRFLDEQASVTAMSWTPEGTSLIVASDDGCFTFVLFTLEELEVETSLKGTTSTLECSNNVFEKCIVPPPKIEPVLIRPPQQGVGPAVQLSATEELQQESSDANNKTGNDVVGTSEDEISTRNTVKQARRRITPTVISNTLSAAGGGIPAAEHA